MERGKIIGFLRPLLCPRFVLRLLLIDFAGGFFHALIPARLSGRRKKTQATNDNDNINGFLFHDSWFNVNIIIFSTQAPACSRNFHSWR